MSQIKTRIICNQLQNHPGFCVCVTVAYGGQNESVNLTEILTRLVERALYLAKESFRVSKLKKCRTKSVCLRLPSFGN